MSAFHTDMIAPPPTSQPADQYYYYTTTTTIIIIILYIIIVFKNLSCAYCNKDMGKRHSCSTYIAPQAAYYIDAVRHRTASVYSLGHRTSPRSRTLACSNTYSMHSLSFSGLHSRNPRIISMQLHGIITHLPTRRDGRLS